MTRRRRLGTPYHVLAAALGRGGSPLTELARNLGERTGASYAEISLPAEVAAWPGPGPAEGAVVVPVPGGRASVSIVKPDGLSARDEAMLAQTVDCVALLARDGRLAAEVERRAARSLDLQAQVLESRRRLLAVHALERRSLVTEVLSASTPALAGIRRAVSAAAPPAELGALLDDLIERFRVTVRGIRSPVLEERGLFAALEELAVDLPRPMRLSGAPAHGMSREVAAVLYHVSAAILLVLSDTTIADPVQVTVRGATVRIECPVEQGAAIGAALPAITAQLTALGGTLERAVGDFGIRLVLALPERLESPVETGPAEPPADPVTRSGDPHQAAELAAAAALRAGTQVLPAALAADAERLLGATGAEPHTRLGLPAESGQGEIRQAAMAELDRWRRRADQLAARQVCRTVVRTLEGLLRSE